MRTARPRTICAVALLASAAWPSPAPAQSEPPRAPSFEDQFADPPASARPRVWWHWLNGNITQDGIRKDLEWLRRIGIGGVQNFDADLATPQVVEHRLAYMSPEWKDAFRFAVATADRLGLEFAIASSPGWSETGGPWVPPEDAMKKLVWSEAVANGGQPLHGPLPLPPSASGPFQDLARPETSGVGASAAPLAARYGDIAVFAVPDDATALPTSRLLAPPGEKSGGATILTDGAYGRTLDLISDSRGSAGLEIGYADPATVRTATIFVANARAGPFGGIDLRARIEASDDGENWRVIATPPLGLVPTTVDFAPVRARRFRLTLEPDAAPSNGPAEPGIGTVLGGGGPPAAIGGTPIKVAEFRLSSRSQIDRSEAKSGFSIVADYLSLPAAVAIGDDKGIDPSQVIDLTDRVRADGTLDWTPPGGRWRIVRMGWSLTGATNHPASREATGLEVDKYDAAAVRRYIDGYLDRYQKVVGAGMVGARGIGALLTDSTEVGPSNWTPDLVAQFRKRRGYDPTPWFPALTGVVVGSRAASDAFLFDYRRTLADLMATSHYATLAEEAHKRGMRVYGEALEDGRPVLGDDMAMRSHADIPMAAMWSFSKEAGPRPTFIADAKGASSIAHLLGRPVVAAESFTSLLKPWASAPGDLRRVVDLEFALGVNRPVIHTSVHQPLDDKLPGLSLAIFGQYFTRHETWAEMARPWIDYIARSSFLLQQGRNVADVAYFYGDEAPLTGLFGDRAIPDVPFQNAYDFLDAGTLLTLARVENGRITTPGGASYRLLYLGGSSDRMTLATLERIAALVADGATVVGDAPSGSPSRDDPLRYRELVARLWPGGAEARVGRGRVIAARDLSAALGTAGIAPDVSYVEPGVDHAILFVHRQLDDGHIYFLSNRSDRAILTQGRFRVTGFAPDICRADTGRCEAASFRRDRESTVVTLPFEKAESLFVVFRRHSDAPDFRAPVRALGARVGLTGAWQVRFQPGRGAPPMLTLPRLLPLSARAEAGVKYFSGTATYSTSFPLPRGARRGSPLMLDLGAVGDLASVQVNGVPVGTAWHAPFAIDIGAAIRPGQNRLEIAVANLWVNRLIGDAQPGAKPITWTPLPTYRADAPLRPSGLMGPVTLRVGR